MKGNKKYTSKNFREDPMFLRNDFPTTGKHDIPIVKKCDIDITKLRLLPVGDVKINAKQSDLWKTVHFFVDDYKMEKYYKYPDKYIARLAQYKHVITPDYSLYTDMPIALQIANIFKSRYCGAFWQYHNLSVIPTISWSTSNSFDFCFDGIEPESVVAISTVGCFQKYKEKVKRLFLEGYFEMLKRIRPKQVLCYGNAYPEMGEEVIYYQHKDTERRINNGR